MYRSANLSHEPPEPVDAFLREKEEDTRAAAVQHRDRKRKMKIDRVAREAAGNFANLVTSKYLEITSPSTSPLASRSPSDQGHASTRARRPSESP